MSDFYRDGYNIDDAITIIIDMLHGIQKRNQGIPLILHALLQPVNINKPNKSVNILPLRKLEEEGTLSEYTTMLDWEINTRALVIPLPKLKAIKWTRELDDFPHK